MSAQPFEQQIASMKRKFDDYLDRARLNSISGQVSSLTTDIGSLGNEVEKLRSRGYAFRSYLENKAQVMQRNWDGIRRNVERTVETEREGMRDDLDRVEQVVRKLDMAGADVTMQKKLVPMLEGELERLGAQVEAAERHVRHLFEKLQTDTAQMQSELRQIDWILDQRDEASFDFYAGEAIFLAAEAEWLDGRDNPDGIIYLTDQRLVFEQKEKTGKKLGFFGGKHTQEVEWETPLNLVEKVEAENKGFLGGKDMLHFTFGSGAAYPKASVEVKGSADCKHWAAQIQRMISGDAANERAIAPDPELIESLRNAPTACHVCGGLLPQIVAGQNQITCEYCGSVIRI